MVDETDIEIEDEIDVDDTEIIYQITSFGADYLVDGLIARLEREDIYRPNFQRQFVWTLPQASRFIESILLGLPIPGIFLYREEETQKHLIIDGLQRLTTLHAFKKGRIPSSNRVFKLQNVKERFEGKTLDELDAADARRFFDTTIHATIIQQSQPTDDNSSVFHIFDRLNSGGTPLQSQEIRAAIYHGPFQDLLEELNSYDSWRHIFGPVNKRAKDQELILRFFALYADLKNYKAPMRLFLNKFMRENRRINSRQANSLGTVFKNTTDLVVELLGEKPFRPVRALNVAVFDSVMVALASKKNNNPKAIREGYRSLLRNKDYLASVSKSTSSESNVTTRMKLAREHLTL